MGRGLSAGHVISVWDVLGGLGARVGWVEGVSECRVGRDTCGVAVGRRLALGDVELVGGMSKSGGAHAERAGHAETHWRGRGHVDARRQG